MGKAPKSVMKFELWLWNDDDPDQPHHHQVVAGIRERLEASKHYKRPVGEVLQTGNEEAMAFLAWLAAKRYDVVGDDVTFDAFIDQLVSVDPEDDGDLAEQLEGVLASEGIEDPDVRKAAAAAAVAAIADAGADSEGDPDGGRDE